MTNGESAQGNFHPIFTVQDDDLSTATSEHFFWLRNEKQKNCLKQHTTKVYPTKECEKNKAPMHKK